MSESLLPIGFEKSFDSSVLASQFYLRNKERVEKAAIMAIPYGDTCKVVVRKINQDLPKDYRRMRSWGADKQLYGSDYLPGGVNGIVNHADGKRYDSKSAYEKAVKAKGCRVVGNDWNNQDLSRREVLGDYNVRADLTKATKRVLEQHGR